MPDVGTSASLSRSRSPSLRPTPSDVSPGASDRTPNVAPFLRATLDTFQKPRRNCPADTFLRPCRSPFDAPTVRVTIVPAFLNAPTPSERKKYSGQTWRATQHTQQLPKRLSVSHLSPFRQTLQKRITKRPCVQMEPSAARTAQHDSPDAATSASLPNAPGHLPFTRLPPT